MKMSKHAEISHRGWCIADLNFILHFWFIFTSSLVFLTFVLTKSCGVLYGTWV